MVQGRAFYILTIGVAVLEVVQGAGSVPQKDFDLRVVQEILPKSRGQNQVTPFLVALSNTLIVELETRGRKIYE